MVNGEDPIRQAADLIRVGRREEARPILARFLQTHPDSVDAWMLMSMSISDRQRQIDCLRQVLRIQPDHSLAQSRLTKLLSGTGTVTTWPSLPSEPAVPSASQSLQGPLAAPAPPTPPFAEGPMPPAAPLPPLPAVGRRTPAPEAPAEAPPAEKPAWSPGGIAPVIFVLALVGLLCAAVAVVAYLLSASRQAAAREAFSQAATVAAFTLPPTWTPTLTPTIAPTHTPRPTATLSPTPTPPIPNPTVLSDMDIVQREVADVRGLEPIIPTIPRFVLTKIKVRPVLAGIFEAGGGTQAALDDEARVLSALGLIKPTYNLYTNALNGLADGIGGFYVPSSDELYVIGTGFGGVERFIFSHEYGHALVDQHFDLDQLGVYPICQGDAQRCQAIQALVEGDATLAMSQWIEQYAGPQDLLDILNYQAPAQIMPEQFAPPFVAPNAQFPYVEGLDFVEAVYARGRWALVNAAYTDLPESTEQILHPGKYFSGDVPEEMPETPLDDILGEGWRLLDSNSLGEWMTYLMLGYGADVEAQLDLALAERAAAGWGGDRYRVYFNDETGQTVMAARWSWDTAGDATTFGGALEDYLHERYGGNEVDSARGQCWEANAQRSCVYRAGRETLWLLAPDSALIEAVLARFPGFS
jgi:hypothetical protein